MVTSLIPVAGIGAELVMHPGSSDAGLQAQYGRWHYSWQGEKQALLDPRFKDIAQKYGYALEL
jgi:hypothetical protein